MKKYLLIRILLIFVNIFLLGTILFFGLTYANFLKWTNMTFREATPIVWRLYKNFLEQRLLYLDWGLTASGDEVMEVIVPKFWISLKYNVLALLVYFPIGVIVGIVSAYWKDGFFDKVFNIIALTLGSIPTYILAFLLIVVLGFQLDLFPPHYSAIPQTFFGKIWGLGIPIIALSAGAISKISRVIRDEMIEALHSEYYLLCITKGLTRRQIFIRHMLRNSIASVLPVMIDVFMLVLMGSFFVEMAFGIRGVAEVMYDSLVHLYGDLGFNFISIDVNTIIVISTFYMLVSFTFSLLVDVFYQIIDPRITIQKTAKGM